MHFWDPWQIFWLLLQRDERVYETALLYGDGVLVDLPRAPVQSAAALPPRKTNAPQSQPNSLISVEGWAPQVYITNLVSEVKTAKRSASPTFLFRLQVNVLAGKTFLLYSISLPGVKAGAALIN